MSVSRWLILFGVYCGLAFTVYAPAFPGGPISDDYFYLMNPWVRQLSATSLPELFDPRSQPTLALNNYAPVRPILHGAQWQLLYDEASIAATNQAYHLTNVLVHVVASGLLAMLLVQASVPLAAAALGGAFFLLHPANVEAVAWLCELWSGVALAFGLGALLLQRRVPALALVLFGLALLTKPQVVCVLPVALLRQWSFRNEPGGRVGWAWMGGGVLILAAVTSAQLLTFFESASAAQEPIHPDLAVQLRTIFALAGRYLAMAVTGFGVAAFQQPPPAVSMLDPWWLFGFAATLAISGLAFSALRREGEEAAWWVWGPAAFLPVSQIFPFLYPFADRYLLFMLPGLIGAVLLAGARIGRSIDDPARRAMLARAAGVAALAVCIGFGAWSHARAGLWMSEDQVLSDAARRWPDGVPAHLLAARRAARAGDLDRTVAELEICRARGWDYYGELRSNPAYENVRATPRFQALVLAIAGDSIARAEKSPRHTQLDLRDIAEAHRLRGENAEAIAALERAIELGGPIDAEVRPALVVLRAQAAREKP
jgi:hypothetical protein